MPQPEFDYYLADGTPLKAVDRTLPDFEEPAWIDDPAHYLPGEALADAVNVAILLGQPLLVTGEPGTGKTQLAWSVARQLGLPPPLVFHTKTTSIARDLFYRYDAVGHFQSASIERHQAVSARRFIEFQALGAAILLSLAAENADHYLPPTLRGRRPVRSVVLIDEIDKAPRDLPNDILHEIDQLSFQVPELEGVEFAASAGKRPVVILTSNSERNLPDAFLRRCVFYHIPFPDEVTLKRIVERRVRAAEQGSDWRLDEALKHFLALRGEALRKPPATAELFDWLRVLQRKRIRIDAPDKMPNDALVELERSYAVLAKSKEDQETMEQFLRRNYPSYGRTNG